MRMTAAFQVLLCLCLLGLSYAAPNTRNIRWCVTSDTEEQKCNDLVTSCHVDNILLTCVKKSSTEDCVRAISNGEADAISLDSKEVYKASLPPYKLKPIMIEGYSEREHTPCTRHRQNVLGGKKITIGAFVPKCDEKGNYVPKQCHGSTGYCWCLNENDEEIEGTRTPPGTKGLTCEDTGNKPHCLKERQKLLSAKPSPTVFVPECDEKGNYRPQQCHGYCWCLDKNGEEIYGSRTFPGKPPKTCEASGETLCIKERNKVLGATRPLLGAFIPDCDDEGYFSPKQFHGSTGYSWCVTKTGEEIQGTRTGPGEPPHTCEVPVETHCIKERNKVVDAAQPLIGAFIPDCDDEGYFRPKQSHGSTGHSWCVTKNGEEIQGTRTGPGEPPHTCEVPGETLCMKKRNKVLSSAQPVLGAFVPDCDEKGNFSPKQCHGSTGNCWCVTNNGEEIQGTRTGPGQLPHTCEVPDLETLHYAVAVVKKSSSFQLDQLKGKRSCHSAVGEAAGWVAPLNVLLEKKLLSLEGPEKKSIEKAAAEMFSASCAPGAQEANLCEQCAGKEDKCKRGPGEPYYGDEGAFRCLKDDKGDVAFVEDRALSGQYSDNFELLCPDNTRRPLSQYKICNLGRVPRHAVVTRSTGDKMKDITDYLLEARKKECKLFSSTHGKDLLFEDTTAGLITLPSAIDTFFFLGRDLFNGMKTIEGAHPPSSQIIRWCPQSKNEKKKCDDWSSVSGGSIKCTEPSSTLECIEKILKGEAEAVGIGVEHMYTALKCGLVPADDEYYNEDDLIPCQVPGAEYSEFGTIRAVALVKKADKEITWNNLEGKKSCHTGVGHMAGWHIPIGLIHKKTKNCDIGSYFSQSCAPGSAIDSNLCKLCIGDPQNTKANTKCSLSDKEAYYGNEGAVRCLVEKGDVAFVPHTAVYENTDGKNPALWAKELKSTDFELLCPDGSRAPVSEYKKCRLLGIPPRTIVTRPESLRDVVRITLNQQSLYGRKGFEKDIFQLFSSSHGQNLLFSDRTQCLVEFDRMLDRDIMDDVFGKPLYKALYKDNNCLPKSALATACSFHH